MLILAGLPSEETSVNQFWIACFTMWVSLLKHPLLPEKESHRFVLLEFQALYSKFFYDYGQERDLDRGKEDHVRLAIIEDLGNIGRALGSYTYTYPVMRWKIVPLTPLGH